MIILTGSNLGERQRDLNAKVKEAAKIIQKFEEVKDKVENSDVDKLFKIDLASEFRDTAYIIEIFKSGDSLFISRALKSYWLYDDSYAYIINADNLHKNVIPFMSSKMKKKLLSTIAANVTDQFRAEQFYKYCMENQLKNIALKFLINTSETFKLEVLKDKSICNLFEVEYVKHFIGLSLTLAEAYVKMFDHLNTDRVKVFRELSYLYTVSEVKYLDLLEKYVALTDYQHAFLGLRISKSIMKKHKDRVLKTPSIYVKVLNKDVVKKYVTPHDAKIYLPAVLPDEVDVFWYQHYHTKYKHILDGITDGKYEFVKQIFTAKYPGELFEMNRFFHANQFFTIMTDEEKETWALKQIASENEYLGVGKDYQWYKFVSFEKAFDEIKKLVLVTTDNAKRADMMLILIDSAKTQRDVEKLLKHYYARHANEQRFIKENFLDRIMCNFNVFEFDNDCWTAFNKMFHNLEVYHVTDYNGKIDYRIVALVHYIINQKEVPEAVRNQINSHMQFYTLEKNTSKLTKEQQEMVFEYLLKFYMDEIKKLGSVPYEDEVKYRLRKYIHFTLDLLAQYERTKEDVPELVNKFMKLDWAEFEFHRLIRDTSEEISKFDLSRDLKKDAKLLIEHLPLFRANLDRSYKYDISTVLRKLKTYFSNDIAKEYFKFFDSLLAEDQLWHTVTQAAAHGIFQLGDEKFKDDIMAKYAPKESAIDHSKINEKWLRIQKAICAHACYSRPPVPLKSMLMYIKGDYVHSCLPMFHYYLANLPLPLCIEFVESLLDTPVSIQKHGIRLAFECFNAESLNTLVLRAWKKTKNVSLRKIIYKAIFTKVCEVTSGQDLLFDTLKQLTLSLQPDDDDEIFNLLISRRLPDHLLPESIEMAWTVVSQFPPKTENQTRMKNLMMFMSTKIEIIRQEFVRGLIEQFIAAYFKEDSSYIKTRSSEVAALVDANWKLAATYIINVKDEADLGQKIMLAKLIFTKFLKESGVHESKRTILKTCFDFIHDLEEKSYCQDFHRYEKVNKIMQLVLETLESDLAIEEIYMYVWDIKLGIMVREVIADSKTKYPEQEKINKEVIKETANNFAKRLGVLIEEMVENELFFATFTTDIQNKIISKTETLKDLIDYNTKSTDMMMNVCLGLMSFEVTQIYLLVVNLLPDGCRNDYEEEFKAIIAKVKTMDNKEIRCNLFRKLADPDFDELM